MGAGGDISQKVDVLCNLTVLADLRNSWLRYDMGNSVPDMGNLPFLRQHGVPDDQERHCKHKTNLSFRVLLSRT